MEPDLFEDIVLELVEVLEVATDDGRVLRWTGTADTSLDSQALEATRPEGERRRITVMFCDLMGSTDLSANLDPEDLREVVRSYQQLGAAAIEGVGGHIAQYLGDGLLVYFGWPTTREDDAIRGVRAGLRIVRGLEELNHRLKSRYGVEIGVRIGLHTGPVVMGEMGGGLTRETLALGQTPNIGARIEGEAERNTVYLSETTARLVKGWFELEDRGLRELKGVKRPMQLFEATQELGIRQRFDVATDRGLTPLVDRHELRARLEETWAGLGSTGGQAILLRGAAGIGKSRLAHYAKGIAGVGGPQLLEVNCSPLSQNTALLPLGEALGSHWRAADDPLGAVRSEVEAAGLDPMATPLLCDLAGVPCPPELGAPMQGWTPQRRRQATMGAIAGVVAGRAQASPTLVLVEDLHWADPSTIEALGAIHQRASDAPVLLLLTSRPEFRNTWEGVSVEEVSGLNADDARELVARTLGGLDVPDDAVFQLADRTDGVPLFVEELAKAVVARGGLANQEGKLVLKVAGQGIPDTLYGCLMARIDALGPLRQLAMAASVIGRVVDFDLLHALVEGDEGALHAELQILVGEELLERLDVKTWQFRHALARDTAAGALLNKTRRELHLKVAAALQEQFPERVGQSPELLAHHLTEGGDLQQAVTWWQNAGMSAMQRSANAEAIAHFRRGLEVIAQWPEGPGRLAMELVFRTLVAIPLTLTRGWAHPDVKAEYFRAHELCDTVGQAPQLIPTRIGVQTFHIVHGEFVKAGGLADETVAIAEASGDPGLILEAHVDRGAVHAYLGNYAQALEHFERVRALYVPEEHHDHVFMYGKNPLAFVDIHSAMLRACTGEVDSALEDAHRALAHTEAWPHPFSHCWAQIGIAITHALRYEPDRAAAVAADLVAEAEAQGFPNWLAQGLTYLGLGQVLAGEVEQGLGALHKGLAIWRMGGAELGMPTFIGFLARAQLHVGQLDEAWASIEEALTVMDQTEERWTEGDLLRISGEIAEQREGPEAAMDWYTRALTSARTRGALTFEVLALTRMARLAQGSPAVTDLASQLAAAVEAMPEGHDIPPMQDARDLLRTIHAEGSP